MNIKNKFVLFFSIIILAFISTLAFLLSRTENMITRSLYNDFSQIASSTAKEIDVFLLERILSLETLSHNEGMKEEIAGVDDMGKKAEVISIGDIKDAVVTNTGAIKNPNPIVRRNITSSGTANGSGISNAVKKTDSIRENEHLQEVLEDFIKINTTFHSVEIISASGRTIAYMVENEWKWEEGERLVKKTVSEKIGRDRTKKQLFLDTKTGNKSYYLQDVVKEDDGSFTIDVAVPIMLTQDGKKVFIGAILGDVNLKHIWEITDGIKIGTTGEVMLYNKSGAILADHYKEKILTYPKIVVPSVQALMRGESGDTIEISEMGTETITAYTPLIGHGEYKGLWWGIQVTQDTEEAFDELNTFKSYSLLLMGIIILLVLFFVYLIHTRISNPIVRLARVAKDIGAGNYMIDMKDIITPSSGSKDEIGLLGQTFKDMLLNLRTNISLMEQYKHTIDESSLVSKTDLQGFITYANKQFCDKTQYTEAELIGKPHDFVWHPDTPKEVFKDFWETVSSKKIWRGIVKNRAKDGSSHWVATTVSPLLDINGNIFEYMAIRTDITELQNTKLRLAESFKKLQENTEELLEWQRISREFELAKGIQDNFLPVVESSHIPHLDSHCVIYAATEIGGDLYDIIPSPSKDEYLLYIGDVTGHGLISGIIMAIVSSLVYALNRETGGDVHLLLQKLNNIVIARIPKKMFITMLFMKYIPSTKTFSYMGAGHERFLIYRKASETVEVVASGGIAVGMFSNMFAKDTSKNFTLNVWDVLFLFTDGITEAQNKEKELFGIDRLIESMKKHHDNSSKVLCEKIFTDIKEFTESDIFIDDVTMMSFRAQE